LTDAIVVVAVVVVIATADMIDMKKYSTPSLFTLIHKDYADMSQFVSAPAS